MHYTKIIGGKIYSTQTATKICELDCRHNRGDFGWHDTAMYRTANGAFFLAGKGGARSMWATSIQNGSSGGEGIRVISEEDAREIAERELTPEKYEEVFGVAEDA
ncbi:hypothetical protein [Acidiphilium angustum]|uniref:hypothetical protein n=1 Tax=Acidiphilium angustum TaxID=523 RepID=UPI000494CD14|nr:hypothetical protein [Acidiphilium angustum]